MHFSLMLPGDFPNKLHKGCCFPRNTARNQDRRQLIGSREKIHSRAGKETLKILLFSCSSFSVLERKDFLCFFQ